ncbi:amidohydrolase [Brevibacillus sp. NRS-1366]|uniref:amidohydrolase n=1 Tax=Brevibacillus sp. NRS-1366 TaxID=3233899 RepID=UPI003D211778
MAKSDITSWIDANADTFTEVSRKIWENPELGYTESFASSLQIQILQQAGFRIRTGIGDIATAFIAEYGTSHPIVGILGEFDALPGLSQQVSPVHQPLVVNGPGHGCGHNLLGTAGVEAVIALKQRMDAENIPGTIRYYGCPAEELLSGKTFMARSGVFADLDCALTWHPGSTNATSNVRFQALSAIEFYFSGITAHAGSAPHLGRSALDAVELMNVGANYMREHVPDGTRIHYQITNGGMAPNIVPDSASVYYFLRGANRKQVDELQARLIKIAQGAAMMTETTVRWEIKAGCYDTLPNLALNELMFSQATDAGQIVFTEEEEAFARELYNAVAPVGSGTEASGSEKEKRLDSVFYHDLNQVGKSVGASTDVGDVSWITPVGQVTTTCAPRGITVHTWQATASFGSTIGMKGMHYAAKIMALTAYDLLNNTNGILERAKAEFVENTKGFDYQAGIPDEVVPPGYSGQLTPSL